MGRDGDGRRFPHLPRPRPPLDDRRRAARHADRGAGRELPCPLARGRAGHLALPLPRRGAHGARHDRPLPGARVRRLVLTAFCALAGLAAPASAAEVAVGIPAKFFLPQQLQIIPGDNVTWTNGDHDTHNLVADDGSFASGLLPSGARFSQIFQTVGVHHYICTLHPYMTGDVAVVPLVLEGPAAIPTAGQPFALTGRAPAGTGPLTLERSAHPGDPFAAAGTVTPAADGSFSAPLVAGESADWRVSDGVGASPAVSIPVVPKVELAVRTSRAGRLLVLSVRSIPARPGDTVRLELYSKERFNWLVSERAKLDDKG